MSSLSWRTYVLLLVTVWMSWVNAFSRASMFFVFTQTLQLSLREHSLLIELAMTLPVSVIAIATAPLLDFITSPWLPACTLATTLLMRIAIPLGVVQTLADSNAWMLLISAAYFLLLLANHFAGTALLLAVKRSIDMDYVGQADREHHHAAQVRVMGFKYSVDNLGIALATALFQLVKWRESTTDAANVAILLYAVPLTVLVLASVLGAWPLLDAVDQSVRQTASPASALNVFSTWGVFFRSADFWRYVGVMALLQIGAIASGFNEVALPFMIMAHHKDGANAPFLLVESINPAIVTLLTPFITMYSARRFSDYTMLVAGTLLSALSVIVVLVAPPDTLIYYVVYVALFSVAETVWAPRVANYIFSVAPNNREASYAAAGDIPGLVARLGIRVFVGLVSNTFCPTTSVGRPDACLAWPIWLIALATGLLTPLSLALLRRCLRPMSIIARQGH